MDKNSRNAGMDFVLINEYREFMELRVTDLWKVDTGTFLARNTRGGLR